MNESLCLQVLFNVQQYTFILWSIIIVGGKVYHYYIWCNHINVDLILFWSTLEIKSRDHGAIWLYVLCRHFTFGQNKSRFLVGVDIINYCWEITENAKLHSRCKISKFNFIFGRTKYPLSQPWTICTRITNSVDW